MFADPDPEGLVQGPENGGVDLALLRPEGRVGVRAGERGDDVDPPHEPKHLDETGEDADGRRNRDDPPEPEELPEQHGPGDQAAIPTA